jgi:hypothetical protein
MRKPLATFAASLFALVVVAPSIAAAAEPEPPADQQSPGASQPPATPNSPQDYTVAEVVVRGRQPTTRELAVMMERFVRDHGAASRWGRIAYWRDPVCPLVVGLSSPFNAFVSRRIRDVAASVKARVGRDACRPNVIVIFTSEPQPLLNTVRQEASVMLGFHYAAQARRLATFDRPVKAWYATASYAEGQEVLDDPRNAAPGGRLGSRLSAPLTTVFKNVLIVANSRVVAGREIGPVADYISMLSPSQARSLEGCQATPSVIDLLSPVCGDKSEATSLTAADRAYLEELYRGAYDTLPSSQRTGIATGMTKKAVKERAAPPRR